MQPAQHHRRGYTGQKAEPHRPGHRGNGSGKERGHQHLALKADVKNPRPFGKQPGKAGQQKRRRKAHSGIEDLQNGCQIHQPALRNIIKSRSSGMRTILSRAPVNRITSAWITTINSRGIDVHSASSAPPW